MDLETVLKEFRKRGFVTDPRGYSHGRSLYNPETKITIHVGTVGKATTGILVLDMVNDGMTFGTGYKKLPNGCEIRFRHKYMGFDQFFKGTFTNRVKKINELASL